MILYIGYYEYCWNECGRIDVCSTYWFHTFHIYAWKYDCWTICSLLICLIKFRRFFQNEWSHFMQKDWFPFCLYPLNLYNSHSGGCEVISHCFMISLYETRSHYVAHTGLKLTNLSSQLAKLGEYQCVPDACFIMGLICIFMMISDGDASWSSSRVLWMS